MIRVAMCAALALASAALSPQRQATSQAPLVTAAGRAVHGPHLRALQLLEQRRPGALPRVRFEWEPIRAAQEYVLTGRWIGNIAWTVHTRQVRVTRGSATTWTPSQITVELALPEGTHSWRLSAVLDADHTREVGEPSLISFAIH